MSVASVSQPTSVQRLAAEALAKMREARDDAAVRIGDTYLKSVESQAPDCESRVVARTAASIVGFMTPTPSLTESARVVEEVGLKALAAGISGPLSRTLATLGLETRAAIDTQTFWGHSGNNGAGQDQVLGSYLDAIGHEASDANEKALVESAFDRERYQARCFDRVAFESKALELVRDGHVDAASQLSLLKDAESKFFQWPDQPNYG